LSCCGVGRRKSRERRPSNSAWWRCGSFSCCLASSRSASTFHHVHAREPRLAGGTRHSYRAGAAVPGRGYGGNHQRRSQEVVQEGHVRQGAELLRLPRHGGRDVQSNANCAASLNPSLQPTVSWPRRSRPPLMPATPVPSFWSPSAIARISGGKLPFVRLGNLKNGAPLLRASVPFRTKPYN
jgi:hypothetical protein